MANIIKNIKEEGLHYDIDVNFFEDGTYSVLFQGESFFKKDKGISDWIGDGKYNYESTLDKIKLDMIKELSWPYLELRRKVLGED